MNANTRSLIQYYIDELYSIASALEEAANEVAASIDGMSTNKYTSQLYECARRYRDAARTLQSLR